MSSFHNNNLLHNLRSGVRMVLNADMSPEYVSDLFKAEGIDMPAALIAGASKAGVLESMGARPITHAVANRHIDVYTKMVRPFVAALTSQSTTEDQDGEGDLVCVENFFNDDE